MYFSKLRFAVLFLFMMSLSAVSSSWAQTTETVNTHARPGYATMTIHVLGAVGQPGLWVIEQDTDLLELLTVVRPSGMTSSLRGGRQNTIIEVYRGDGGSRVEIYSDKLENVLSGSKVIPALQDGDVVTIITKPRLGFTTVATWAGSLASIALLGIRILNLADR